MPLSAEGLPVEILSHIFQDAVESDLETADDGATSLKNLSLVCSKWRGVAQREMFTRLVIDESFPSSMIKEIANNEQHAHIGSYITTLVFVLHPDSDNYKPPPEFPQFLRRATMLREIKLLARSGTYLFGSPSTPELRDALLHLFRLPTFTILASSTTGFPLRALSYCPNLDSLTIRWSSLVPPNYDPYVLGPNTITSPAKLKILQLVGSAEDISRFSHFVADPQNKISTSELRRLSLAFMPTLPKGSGAIFSQCGSIEDLKIIFGVRAEDQHRFEVAETDIAVLKNLRNLSFQQMPSVPRGGPPDGLDYFVTGGLFGQWFLGILANLPNPEQVKKIDYIFTLPEPSEIEDEVEEWLDAIRETAGEEDEAFDDIFSEIDNLLTNQFTGLSTLTIHLPWIEFEYMAGKMPGLRERGILKAHEESQG